MRFMVHICVNKEEKIMVDTEQCKRIQNLYDKCPYDGNCKECECNKENIKE